MLILGLAVISAVTLRADDKPTSLTDARDEKLARSSWKSTGDHEAMQTECRKRFRKLLDPHEAR